MKTLFINATTLDSSRTQVIAKHLLDNYIKGYVEVDLTTDPVPPVDDNTFEIKYKNLEQGNLNHPSLKNALLLKEAELVIIAAPLWNLGFPASLKAFLDDAIITNLTFKYGPVGNIISLCNTKKVILISTSGGPYMKSHTYKFIKDFSFLFLGTTNVKLYKADNLDVFTDCVEKILEKTIAKIDKDFSK